MMIPEEFLDRMNIIIEQNHVVLHSQTWRDGGYDSFEFVTDELVFMCVIMFNKDTRGELIPTSLECSFEDANFESSRDLWPGSTWKMTVLDVMDAYDLPAMTQMTWDHFLGYFVKEFNRNLEEYGTKIRETAKREAAKFSSHAKIAMNSQSSYGTSRFDHHANKMKRLQQRLKVSQTFRLTE